MAGDSLVDSPCHQREGNGLRLLQTLESSMVLEPTIRLQATIAMARDEAVNGARHFLCTRRGLLDPAGQDIGDRSVFEQRNLGQLALKRVGRERRWTRRCGF